jgi:DNA-binding winged helix-turn-helix (wHTH) protein
MQHDLVAEGRHLQPVPPTSRWDDDAMVTAVRSGHALIAAGALDTAIPVWRSIVEIGYVAGLALGWERAFHSVSTREYDLVVVADDLAHGRSSDFLDALRREAGGAQVVVAPASDSRPDGSEAANGGLMHDARSVVAWGPLRMDRARRLAWWDGRAVALTPKQFRLLDALASARGAVLSVHELHEAVFGDAYLGDGERVVAHVRRIRARLEPDPRRPVFLLTVRGEGFRLAGGDATARADGDGDVRKLSRD